MQAFLTSLALVVLLSATHALWLGVADASQLFWAEYERGSIEYSNIDGSGRTTLISGLNGPWSVAFDTPGGHIYWTEYGANKIRRAGLDGSNITDIVIEQPLASPAGLAMDLTNQKIYWSNAYNGVGYIRRSNLDGTGIENVVFTPSARDLVLDGGSLYWTDWDSGVIAKVNVDGTGMRVLASGLSKPYGITLDASSRLLYWADSGSNRVRRIGADGTGEADAIIGLSDPVGLLLHDAKLYWTDFEGSVRGLKRSNLDGTEMETLVGSRLAAYDLVVQPDGPAAVPEPTTLALLIVAATAGMGCVVSRITRDLAIAVLGLYGCAPARAAGQTGYIVPLKGQTEALSGGPAVATAAISGVTGIASMTRYS